MIDYYRKGEYIHWKFELKDKFFVLKRNGYLFGGYYFPVYYFYGGSKFYDGKYEYLYPLPMLGVVDDHVAFIFYDHYEIDEFFYDYPVIDPVLIEIEPTNVKTVKYIYFDEKLIDEYNKVFNLNLKPKGNVIVVETIPFILKGDVSYSFIF